jgi:hypothetical protein
MKLKFWLKAFIPETLYTSTGKELTFRAKVLELSPDKSDTSLLPLLTLLPYLFASYATDQRSFSADVAASARITTVIDIPDHPKEDVHIQRYSDPTHQVRGCLMNLICEEEDGNALESKTSQPKGKQAIERTDTSLHIAFSSSGCNPFFQSCGLTYAPSIAMEFDLDLNFRDRAQVAVSLKGRVSQFPAFEAYLQMDEDKPVCLFRHHPRRGNTPFHLLYGWTPIAVKDSLAIPLIPRDQACLSVVATAASASEAKKEERRKASFSH